MLGFRLNDNKSLEALSLLHSAIILFNKQMNVSELLLNINCTTETICYIDHTYSAFINTRKQLKKEYYATLVGVPQKHKSLLMV